MIRRALAWVLLVVVVFSVVVAFTFPTDTIVRAILDRVPLPDRMQLTFEAAHLRPNGLRLEQVHVVRPSGRPAFDAEWLRLWPSLWGLWRDHSGRPWSIAAATCQGTIDVGIGVGPRGTTPVTVSLEDVELASCLPYVLPQVNAYGRVDGHISAVVGPDRPASEGTLDLRAAAWKPGGPLDDVALRADAGTLVWRLADGRLELTRLAARSTDFEATGSGLMRLLTPIDDSLLDVRVAITPGRTMPPLLRRYFEALTATTPDAQGTRTFRLQGTLRDPSLVAPGRP